MCFTTIMMSLKDNKRLLSISGTCAFSFITSQNVPLSLPHLIPDYSYGMHQFTLIQKLQPGIPPSNARAPHSVPKRYAIIFTPQSCHRERTKKVE